ncbi:MAG: hypothetical protein JJU36_14820 [Phycisphaeraceae bacterium]|nr:hypothetical protein [Phycisphaeraceae bacterium]
MKETPKPIRSGIVAFCIGLVMFGFALFPSRVTAEPAGSQMPPLARALAEWEAVEASQRNKRIADEMISLLARSREVQSIPAVAEARQAVVRAEAALEKALEQAELDKLREQLRQAQAARDQAVDGLLDGAEPYTSMVKQRDAAAKRIEQAINDPNHPTTEALRELAKLSLEVQRIDGLIHHARRAWWRRGEVRPLYDRANRLYNDYQAQVRRNEAVSAATESLREARQTAQQVAMEAIKWEDLGRFAANRVELIAAEVSINRLRAEEALRARQARFDHTVQSLIGNESWHGHVMVPQPPDRRGQARPDRRASIWIPPGTNSVRGVIVSQPPALGTRLATDRWIRIAAADQELAVVYFEALDALFNYTTDTPKRFQDALDGLAKATNRPEVAQVPILAMGHSVSGIFARNIAYWQPERCIGVIHIKSGNMHQHRPDPQRKLTGVPFLSISGEFEEFGPEGGIQPAYGAQTQWIMIREQKVRLRRIDPANLMSLIVHPTGDHGNWSPQLSRYCAIFIRAAASKRIPAPGSTPGSTPGTAPGNGPVKCLALDWKDGWLSDARLTEPRHPPAPVSEYAGDRADTLWHLDEATARAAFEYHKDQFVLPDTAVTTPVSEDWVGLRLD